MKRRTPCPSVGVHVSIEGARPAELFLSDCETPLKTRCYHLSNRLLHSGQAYRFLSLSGTDVPEEGSESLLSDSRIVTGWAIGALGLARGTSGKIKGGGREFAPRDECVPWSLLEGSVACDTVR